MAEGTNREYAADREPLGEALDAWRALESREGAFSPKARAALFGALREGPGEAGGRRRLDSLFLPLRRWVTVGAIPTLACAAMASWLLLGGWNPGPTVSDPASVRVEALKVGDRVVFTIANGGQAHTVMRTSSASGAGEALSVDGGRFSDSLEDGSDLVFYRID